MQVEQKNLWEGVTKNAVRENSSKAIAAYQVNMPEKETIFGAQVEHFDKSAGASTGSVNMATYENPAKQKEQETVAEQVTAGALLTADDRKNEAAVVANMTSAEDGKQLEEDGFSIMDSDSRTIITVTDKIKAALAKAGVDISQYGDGLSKEQLEEITGNPAVANQILQALSAYDLPATAANISDSEKALAQAASISNISDGAMAYLVKNQLEPSIYNVYIAEYSAQQETVEVTEADYTELEAQIQQIIEEAGFTVDEETVADSKWLLANQIPLTVENLQYFADLKNLSHQMENDEMDWNQLVDSMAKAVSSGHRPGNALMITARRQLEETRLVMTNEARVTMEKQGIEIDTQPLEELVEDLKEQEKQYYRELMDSAGVMPTAENVESMAQTMDVFDEMKSQPAYVLGQTNPEDTIETIHENGAQLQQELARASESYETLMTSPRKDMGDSIQKAFSNVDDILKDMNLETSEGNRRAVRILAYNNTEITEENIVHVKAMDEQMQRAFRNMNPAVALEMIRRGENPLDMNMEQLNKTAELIKQETGNEEQERFSKYLYKLEQNHEISEEERSSYIGIYRLIAQVEKTDGAALGFLMNQGADITMRNLLTAVRSGKKGAMDYTVSDEFEGVEGTVRGVRIDEQIEVGFQQNCIRDLLEDVSPQKLAALGEDIWWNMTPEQLAEALAQMEEPAQEQAVEESYRQEQLAMYQQALETPEEVYAFLDRYDITNSIANIMAATELLRYPNQAMERLWKKEVSSIGAMEKIADLKNKVLEDFGEALKEPEELEKAQEQLAEVAEHIMDSMIIEKTDIQMLDIRSMRQITTQFTLCAKKAKEESYMIPVKTGDFIMGVSLKVIRGKKEKGFVDITFDSERLGKVAASFQAKEKGISGMIAVSDEDTRQLLTRHLDMLADALQTNADVKDAVDISVTWVSDLSLTHYEMAGISREQKMAENGELAEDKSNAVQTSRLYGAAESFIQSIQLIQSL